MDYNFDYWRMMEPMKYYDKHREELSDNLKKKYDAMINNENEEYLASVKWDGEWTMFIKWDGHILIRSRSLSKVTGEYGDKTLHLPHLVEEMSLWPDNSVVLGEVCWGEYGTVSTDVGTILRCLPAKAVERQKDRKLVVKVFDILAWDNNVCINDAYVNRSYKVKTYFNKDIESNKYFTATKFCPKSLTPAEFADSVISEGGEGVVIKKLNASYERGKRNWSLIKLKQEISYDLRIIDVEEGSGQFKDAVGALICKFKDSNISIGSGLTSEERKLWWKHKEFIIGHIAEIKAMRISSKGVLREPVFKGIRYDKDKADFE